MAGIYSSCAEALNALAQGPGQFACHDFDTVREVAMCDAWHRMETGQHPTFKDAIDAAWQDIHTQCDSSGGDTPEHRPRVTKTLNITDAHQQPVSRVAMEDDTITVCDTENCRTVFTNVRSHEHQAIEQAMTDLYPVVGYHVTTETEGGDD